MRRSPLLDTTTAAAGPSSSSSSTCATIMARPMETRRENAASSQGDGDVASPYATTCRWGENECDEDDEFDDDDFEGWGGGDGGAPSPVRSATTRWIRVVRERGSRAVVVSVETIEGRRLRRRRPPWTPEVNEDLRSALETTARSKGATVEFGLECVGFTLGLVSDPSAALTSSLLAPSRLIELQLVQCALSDLQGIRALPFLESLRVTDCHVHSVPSQEWKACLTHLTALKSLRLEAQEMDNSALYSVACGIRHVTDVVSIGPLYNPRQFFPSLRTIVQECRSQHLDLFGGGTRDSNLVHVVNGLLFLPKQRQQQRQQQQQQQQRGSVDDSSSFSHCAVRSLSISNFAGSKATLAKLFRGLHLASSHKDHGLRHFSLSLAVHDKDGSSPSFSMMVPVAALLQSNPPHLQSLSIDPPLLVDKMWEAPLLRAVQRNTHLQVLEGFVPHEDPSRSRDAARRRWDRQIAFSLELNRCGRRALLPRDGGSSSSSPTSNVSSCPALWPILLRHVVARSRDDDPNVLFYFVKAYAGRN